MVAAHSNDRKLAAKSVQDGSLRLYLCVMLHRQPLICDGGEAQGQNVCGMRICGWVGLESLKLVLGAAWVSDPLCS